MKIPSATFRWVEYELYNLEKHKKELKLLKEEILLHTPDRLGGGNVSGVISDQTGDKVVRLMSDPRINSLENKIRVIEGVLRRKVFRDIYELKYKEGLSVEECCKRMGIEKGMFKLLREILICKIAKNLGEGS